MDRATYNTCMKPYIRGKDKTKEERQAGFCVGAKLCSGKAKTEEEARALCDKPRLPKWAGEKKAEPEEEKLTCPQRMNRTLQAIVDVQDLIKAGKTEDLKAPLAAILQDIHACAPEELVKLANDTVNDVKKTSGEFFFKGEGREMVNDLKTLSSLLQEEKVMVGGPK